MKPLSNPISAAHRVEFHGYMIKWQQLLNLNDWRIAQSPEPAAAKNLAELIEIHLGQRLATYRLGRSFGPSIAVNAVTLEETALHETLHIFLYPLIQAAKAGASDESLDTLEHSLINTLERLLMKAQP